MQNKNLTIIGVILILVIAVQGYFIYDLKKEVNTPSDALPDLIAVSHESSGLDKLFGPFDDKDFRPLKEIQKMQQEMDRVFGQFNSHFMNHPTFKDSFMDFDTLPLSDFADKGDSYEIKMNIPGSDNNKIRVDTKNNNLLEISAELEKTKEDNSSNYFKRERYVQKFHRIFTVPDDSNIDKMEQEYKNGVLTIKIPKK